MWSKRPWAPRISQFVSIGTPRPLRFQHLTAGLLAHGYAPFHLPSHGSRSGPAHMRRKNGQQSAYSCGGSHGLGPFWVFLTVFPINPLGVIRRGTVSCLHRTCRPRRSSLDLKVM